jgi:hypothetical protein
MKEVLGLCCAPFRLNLVELDQQLVLLMIEVLHTGHLMLMTNGSDGVS